MISQYVYSGANPVECNAPTFVDLQWTVKGATTVEMHIDGGPAFTHYPSGSRKETLPLSCDNTTHSYALWAIGNGAVVKKSISIATKKTA